MTEYPYDENPDPNDPNQQAERLIASLQEAIHKAEAFGKVGQHDQALVWIKKASTMLWSHKGNLAELLRANANGTSYDVDAVRSGRLTRDGIEI